MEIARKYVYNPEYAYYFLLDGNCQHFVDYLATAVCIKRTKASQPLPVEKYKQSHCVYAQLFNMADRAGHTTLKAMGLLYIQDLRRENHRMWEENETRRLKKKARSLGARLRGANAPIVFRSFD